MFSPEQQQGIEQELALVTQYEPHFAKRVMDAIEAGQIDASTYIIGKRGCFYGHATGLRDTNAAMSLAWQMRRKLCSGDSDSETPIEALLSDERIGPGDDLGQPALADLYELLKPYTLV